MSDHSKADSTHSTVSSLRLKRHISVRVSSLVVALMILVVALISFYGGIVYQKTVRPLTSANSIQEDRHFVMGVVVYISPTSISIDDQRSGAIKRVTIQKNTTISIDGRPATASQIKAGELALIRVTRKNAAVDIIVNSSFTD